MGTFDLQRCCWLQSHKCLLSLDVKPDIKQRVTLIPTGYTNLLSDSSDKLCFTHPYKYSGEDVNSPNPMAGGKEAFMDPKMHLWLCMLFMSLIIGQSWASSMNVTLTVLKKSVQKGPLTIQVHSDGSQAVKILNRKSQYSSRNGNALSGTTLKWVRFQGSAPSGAVSIWNGYAERTEYPCYESGCTPGFYSPNRGPYCFYPYGDKEHKNAQFWLLINENNFESLKWQEDSWGDVPSNSINSCPGYRLYVGKNKYGLGKVDPHNKAFFIGIDGKEYWYKYYDVLVVYKDYLSQRIYNVHYMKERGTYTNQTLVLVSTRITNNDCNTVKKITSLSKTITNERRWDFNTSISIGVSSSMTAGIFSIVNMGWSITLEETFSWSEGSTMTESVTFSETVEVDVPPNHTCDVSMEGQRMYGNIPFTATVTREYRNGDRRSATVQGVSTNTIVAHVDTYVKRCQPIPNATP
ncbi:PREDICTED: natterin-3-like, partial [Gekko japonicus]|uniref:Natterin-3-like n=1 Tax=Gekko japonicus TaxID=146911 RepID=A0ABM1KEG2_GEKJA